MGKKKNSQFESKFDAKLQKEFHSKVCRGENHATKNYVTGGLHSIAGLNSNQITEYIYGSQRPSTHIIREYKIPHQFQKMNIHAVFNLQETHEHPKCSYNKLWPEGFSYKFDEFESFDKHPIKVYHFPIIDVGVPNDVSYLYKIVQKMDLHIKNKQAVLVHCHVGVGRTAMIIVCYLLYSKQCDSVKAAIEYVTERRRVCMSFVQEDFIKLFYDTYLDQGQINRMH